MRRSALALVSAVAASSILGGAAAATGPGGWDHLGHGATSALPALNGHVNALNSDNPGILYVGGPFTDAGGKANADHLAMWDGSAWSAVSGSATLNGAVDAIAYHAGHVYAGGEFTNVGGNPNLDFLAEWTGTAWRSPCVGLTANPITAQVAALQIIGNALYVGGSFADGGGIESADFLVACNLTTREASSTVPSTSGAFNGGIAALAADSNGTLYAGGNFINLGGNVGEDHVAYLEAGTWHQMGGGHAVDSIVRSLSAHATNVYVGTDAVNIAGIDEADHIAKWNAQTLAFGAMGAGTAGSNGWFNSFAFLYGITTYGPLVFVAGSFQNADGQATADRIAYFDGATWHSLGTDGAGNGPFNGDVNDLAVYNSRLIAGGGFTDAGGDGLADAIGTYAIHRPDARIGTAAVGPFIGNNVYSASGAAESKTISVQRGHSTTVYADVQNDGLVEHALKVTGASGSSGFSLTYFNGATNVTSQVVAGTYSTGSLARGAHLALRVVVHVATASANSGSFIISVVAAPGAPTDAVRIVVNAT